MRVAGIVAEYNPFHNGHKYQIDTLRSLGFTHIVTAMSGNFVQRGDVAIADKWARAEMALKSGADLVLEIPTCFCLAPAEKYCFSAVELLNNSGVVDNLCFGSECGNIEILSRLAKILSNQKIDKKIKSYLKISRNYIEARERAVMELYGDEYLSVLRSPNDILGIEYLSALKKLDSKIQPIAVKREGVGHNDLNASGNFASASTIRDMIKNGEDYEPYMPENAVEIIKKQQEILLAPAFLQNAERVVLAKLRELRESDFERLQDVSEGLHNRLYDAVKNADSLDRLYVFAKTRRYTMARIRRLVLNASLGIFDYEKPPYLRVLGFSENGKLLLKEMKEKSALQIVTSYSDAKKSSQKSQNYFEKEASYTDFYTMLTPKIAPTGLEFSKSIVKI